MTDRDIIRLDNQLCFMLYACSRAMTRAYQPMLKKLGITYPQYIVLMVLWEWHDQPPVEQTVKALGERLQLDSGTLTPLLKRLEQAGLVSRRRDDSDERRVLVEVTAQGYALSAKASEWLQSQVGEHSVSLDKISQLRGELRELLDHLTGEV
ncbi:MarR family winged helix-turn-helix transcriptional regulator [Pseudomaricurvus alkylphenolicus]|uniref:MarR family winged helix-turn-helix transcriptional regulator n=1 Tax=Pseudomaricurvus alkylphenolicus TaxID=1306991 RepID=UPI0030B8D75A